MGWGVSQGQIPVVGVVLMNLELYRAMKNFQESKVDSDKIIRIKKKLSTEVGRGLSVEVQSNQTPRQ